MWRDLVSGVSITTSPRHKSLGAHAQIFLVFHRQGQADSVRGAVTAARQRLILAPAVVIRWSRNLVVIFIIFEILCTSGEVLL
jgi:hypothetical protein